MDTSDEWIRERTGIAARHFADEGVAASDLATQAARSALSPSLSVLESAGIPRSDIAHIAVFTTADPTSELYAVRDNVPLSIEAPKPKEVPDLMAALEASIASAKTPGASSDGDEQEEKPKKKPASRSRGSSSNGKKKTAAKKS